MSLVPCPECRRHVKVSEPACPFCGESLATLAAPRPRRAGVRSSRAAFMLATAAGAGAALAGCADSSDQEEEDLEVQPVYGIPVPQDSGMTTDPDSGSNQGGGMDGTDNGDPDVEVQPVYGIPIPEDAGMQNTEGEDAGAPVPVYGAAPAED